MGIPSEVGPDISSKPLANEQYSEAKDHGTNHGHQSKQQHDFPSTHRDNFVPLSRCKASLDFFEHRLSLPEVALRMRELLTEVSHKLPSIGMGRPPHLRRNQMG